ncbi:hypothetical protein V8E53_005955 [Lactarius tabidus]
MSNAHASICTVHAAHPRLCPPGLCVALLTLALSAGVVHHPMHPSPPALVAPLPPPHTLTRQGCPESPPPTLPWLHRPCLARAPPTHLFRVVRRRGRPPRPLDVCGAVPSLAVLPRCAPAPLCSHTAHAWAAHVPGMGHYPSFAPGMWEVVGGPAEGGWGAIARMPLSKGLATMGEGWGGACQVEGVNKGEEEG